MGESVGTGEGRKPGNNKKGAVGLTRKLSNKGSYSTTLSSNDSRIL